MIYMNKAVDSMYESKSDRDICAELAPRLGLSDFREGHSDGEWLKIIVDNSGDVADFEEFKREGAVKIKVDKPFVAFTEQIEDPANNPFPTLSGKIEIYCEHMAEMDNPLVPPIAQYLPPPEGYDDPLAGQYPLQLLTTHHKTAVHSTVEKLPWLDELSTRRVWINTGDAVVRGIADGDQVLVVNDRGKVLMQAYVTERIMPGVVNIGQGAWFDIDENGIDHGGCANVLVPSEHSPGGAWSANTVLVEISKA
jgi:anaerobic dimethyl sulfoxide reductase subunit A